MYFCARPNIISYSLLYVWRSRMDHFCLIPGTWKFRIPPSRHGPDVHQTGSYIAGNGWCKNVGGDVLSGPPYSRSLQHGSWSSPCNEIGTGQAAAIYIFHCHGCWAVICSWSYIVCRGLNLISRTCNCRVPEVISSYSYSSSSVRAYRGVGLFAHSWPRCSRQMYFFLQDFHEEYSSVQPG